MLIREQVVEKYRVIICILVVFLSFSISSAGANEHEAGSDRVYLDAKQRLLKCTAEYDEFGSDVKKYFSNGACVVDSIKKIMTSSVAKIQFEKEYKCSDLDGDYSDLGKEPLLSFSSSNEFLNVMETIEWINSSHYYNYLPCHIKGSIEIDDLLIKFTINLGGPGVFYFRNKQYIFSDPKHADCFDESYC